MVKDKLSMNILNTLNETSYYIKQPSYTKDKNEIENRVSQFNIALDKLCNDTGLQRIGRLKNIGNYSSAYSIKGIWYEQRVKIPNEKEYKKHYIYFNASNNTYRLYFFGSDSLWEMSGIASFDGSFDRLAKQINNLREPDKQQYEEEKRRYTSCIAHDIIDMHSRKVYKGVPRRGRDRQINIEISYARDFLSLSKEAQMEIVKHYTDLILDKESQDEFNTYYKAFKYNDLKDISYDDVYDSMVNDLDFWMRKDNIKEINNPAYNSRYAQRLNNDNKYL